MHGWYTCATGGGGSGRCSRCSTPRGTTAARTAWRGGGQEQHVDPSPANSQAATPPLHDLRRSAIDEAAAAWLGLQSGNSGAPPAGKPKPPATERLAAHLLHPQRDRRRVGGRHSSGNLGADAEGLGAAAPRQQHKPAVGVAVHHAAAPAGVGLDLHPWCPARSEGLHAIIYMGFGSRCAPCRVPAFPRRRPP